MLIHQESIITAAPEAVYEVLTDGQKFAAATGMPAQLSDREGEAFTLFGGRVEGRQIELVPGQRIVQAWRFGATHPSEWDAGVYSVVRFTLSGQQDGTASSSTTLAYRRSGMTTSPPAIPASTSSRWSATSPP
jgi:uncharacterized protein YndB with AHSA1/START domain